MNEGMENLKQIEDLENNTTQLKRIADAMEQERNYRTGEVTELRGIRNAMEEILRLVKKDMEPRTKKKND